MEEARVIVEIAKTVFVVLHSVFEWCATIGRWAGWVEIVHTGRQFARARSRILCLTNSDHHHRHNHRYHHHQLTHLIRTHLLSFPLLCFIHPVPLYIVPLEIMGSWLLVQCSKPNCHATSWSVHNLLDVTSTFSSQAHTHTTAFIFRAVTPVNKIRSNEDIFFFYKKLILLFDLE